MLIICNNTKGISSNSTINKLIVIGIFLNNIKMKFRINKNSIWTVYDGIQQCICHPMRSFPF